MLFCIFITANYRKMTVYINRYRRFNVSVEKILYLYYIKNINFNENISLINNIKFQRNTKNHRNIKNMGKHG